MNKYSHALVALVGAVLIALPVQAKRNQPQKRLPLSNSKALALNNLTHRLPYNLFPIIEISSSQRSTAKHLLLKFGLILTQQVMRAVFLDAKLVCSFCYWARSLGT